MLRDMMGNQTVDMMMAYTFNMMDTMDVYNVFINGMTTFRFTIKYFFYKHLIKF